MSASTVLPCMGLCQERSAGLASDATVAASGIGPQAYSVLCRAVSERAASNRLVTQGLLGKDVLACAQQRRAAHCDSSDAGGGSDDASDDASAGERASGGAAADGHALGHGRELTAAEQEELKQARRLGP